MRQSKLLNGIKEEISKENIKEPFRSSDLKCLEKSPAFLSKHCVGNGKYNEYFIRVSRGLYKVK